MALNQDSYFKCYTRITVSEIESRGITENQSTLPPPHNIGKDLRFQSEFNTVVVLVGLREMQ